MTLNREGEKNDVSHPKKKLNKEIIGKRKKMVSNWSLSHLSVNLFIKRKGGGDEIKLKCMCVKMSMYNFTGEN